MKNRLQRSIITVHRWIGIAACLYFIAWCLSGIVLMYVSFPKLTPQEKLAWLKPIDWRLVAISPDAALSVAGLRGFPKTLRLEMSLGQPVYRIVDWSGRHSAVSAVDGRTIGKVLPGVALQIAQDYAASPQATVDRAWLDHDVWTGGENWSFLSPLHRISLNDQSGRQLYVSSVTGEVVLDTSRWERFWNYLGAVPHWLYFAAIRNDRQVWRWVTMSAAMVGIVVTISGLWLGISHLRVRKRYVKGRMSPFRGWMKWHHLFGVTGGFLLFTWMVTGWLAANPFGALLQRLPQEEELQRYAGQQAPRFDLLIADQQTTRAALARVARLIWLAGRPLVVLEGGTNGIVVVDPRSSKTISLSDSMIFDAALALLPNASATSTERLEKEDEYWHSGFSRKTLPVLRVRFDDRAGTWYHIDPQTTQVIGLLDSTGRANRWIFQAIHDIDLHILLRNRPLWDVIVMVLMAAATTVSISAVVIGWRRLRAAPAK